MTTEFLKKLQSLSKQKLAIIFFTIWQYFSILGIGILNWPKELIWLNFIFLFLYIIFSPVYESILLLVVSIPFFVVLPNSFFPSLAMWRPLFFILFVVWLFRNRIKKFSEIIFLPWDKVLAFFLLVGILVTLLFANFKKESFLQIIFWLNIYFFYLVLINTLKNKKQIFEFVRYLIWSITIIVTLGFAQLIGSFFSNLDVFWVYWANNFSSLYYGQNFANVALYSNSWFSYNGDRQLRMFSVMPDSQSFAYVCLIGLCIATALTQHVFVHIRKWLWSGIRFVGLGVMLSGTRAVWVGMLVPFFLTLVAYFKNFQKHLAKKFLTPFVIIFVLFAISPLINRGLSILRIGGFKENFISRAKSIYDLREPSNIGRLKIWKESLMYAINHPFGVGFGNFISSINPKNQIEYRALSEEIHKTYNLPKKYISAHSLYLQILVEAGIFGFIIFCWFWYIVIKYLFKFILNYKSREDFLVYFVAQALVMVFWILGSAFFDVTLLNDKVLMYFFVNLGLAGLVVKKYQEYEG